MRNIVKLMKWSWLWMFVSSCHFGHSAEDILNKYNDVPRDLTFRFQASGPGGQTRVILEDEELNGVRSTWEKEDQVALFDFGQVFVTTNGGKSNSALVLSYKEHADENPDDGIDFAVFAGQALAKMGDDVFNGKSFALVYPAKAVQDESCASTEVNFSFVGQDGSLEGLQKNYLCAWGCATGICADKVVTLYEGQTSCSSNLPWHAHLAGGEDIVLDNKMCIIRFSMVIGKVYAGDPDTTWMTLQQYLNTQNLEIASIDVANINPNQPGISEANLLLQTGELVLSQAADSFVTVVPLDTLKEIRQENATPVSYEAGAERVAWGSTFYLSVPCPEKTKLDFHPLLTVKTRSKEDRLTMGPTYFGAITTKTVKEGDYYMTAPVVMLDDETKLQEEAKIYLYYHSSFVWDSPIDIY